MQDVGVDDGRDERVAEVQEFPFQGPQTSPPARPVVFRHPANQIPVHGEIAVRRSTICSSSAGTSRPDSRSVYCASLLAACRYLLMFPLSDVLPLPNRSTPRPFAA